MVQGVGTAFEKLIPRERRIQPPIAAYLHSREIAHALCSPPNVVGMRARDTRLQRGPDHARPEPGR